MAIQNRTTLKSYFETYDKPTESQFADLIDSMVLKGTDGFISEATVPYKGDQELTPAATTGDNATTGLTLTQKPIADTRIDVFINGENINVGDGIKTADCYFSSDSGTTAKALVDILNGDTLYYNGVICHIGNLDTNDRIDINYHYMKPVAFNISNPLTEVKISTKILIVDPIDGVDANAVKGSFVNKYKTIAAAETAASSGEVIVVTSLSTNEVDLGKDGITYHFLPGAGVNNTTSTGKIFSDLTKTTSGANPLFFKITGHGDFTARTEPSVTDGAVLYLYEGSSAEFEFNSSSILNLDGTKADSGFHFWAQAEYINAGGSGKIATLKGKVERDVTGGHYFLGAHSGNCNIDVGGNVDISAIFIQAEGCQLIDLNVDGKITCGYSTTHSYKYFATFDRVPWFTGNVDTISGTNTHKVTAKRMEWVNSGEAQTVNFDIINVIEYHDATGTHNLNYIDINIDEILIKAGDQATQRAVFRFTNNNSSTYTRLKLDKCKLIVEDGFPLFNIASSNEKEYLDMMFQDCSVDYQHDSLGAGAIIMPTRYIMFHITDSRFKVSAQGVTDNYSLLDDSTSTDKNVQITNVVTNAQIPTSLVNYGTAISSNNEGIRSVVTDIRII